MEAGLGRGGIDAGFGRGVPEGLGRAPPGGAGREPWVMPNGLLPPVRGGRAPVGPGVAVGRGLVGAPGPAPGAPGPPAGPGLGAAGRGVSGPRSCAARTAASWSAFSWAARTSAAATSMSCALVGAMTGVGATGAGVVFLAGAFLGGAGRAPDVGPSVAGAEGGAGVAAGAPAASMVARSRRATGASMVLDADLTNSPISFNLARTVLLSTPSSFASSCTRGLPATALLILRSAGSPAGPHFGT
jgi:hypothetical protein